MCVTHKADCYMFTALILLGISLMHRSYTDLDQFSHTILGIGTYSPYYPAKIMILNYYTGWRNYYNYCIASVFAGAAAMTTIHLTNHHSFGVQSKGFPTHHHFKENNLRFRQGLVEPVLTPVRTLKKAWQERCRWWDQQAGTATPC